MKLLRARERQQRRPDPAETETDPWRLGLRGSRASGWPLVLRAGWAWMDLNHRPLPYQGSALTELSYRPLPFPGMRMALTLGKCRRDRLSHSPENPSVGLPEGDLDTATQMGDEVVDHGSDRGQCGDQDDVHRAEQHGVAEDPGGREPVAATRPRGRTRAGRDAA